MFYVKQVEAWRADGWPERFSIASDADPSKASLSMQVVVEEVRTDTKPIDFSSLRTPPEGYRDFMDPNAPPDMMR